MGGASKVVEHMEHAAHAPHHDGVAGDSQLGMRIGATMAIIGALLALLTMMGSAARTELLGLYTQETIASLRVEASSTKYRLLETQLRQLVALSPHRAEVQKADAELDAIAASGPEAMRDASIARIAVKPVLSGLMPPHDDLERFARMIRAYREERERAGDWLRTFEAPKTALTNAIEHYEWAELCAELGIVGSSIALLFASRRVWWATLALGGAGLLILVLTFFPTSHQVHAAEETIAAAKAKVDALGDGSQADQADDDALLQEIEGRAP